jgi:3-dehydroquinate synthase
MVDAAIGGKTGVDFGGLKNMIGLFSQPQAVIIDSTFLKTLPAKQYRNGLAEVLKHAFISDPELLTLMDGNQDELISRSIQVKLDVVQRDEFETGERKKLNFGHTIGHAVESHLLDAGKDILHGEAIAAGMIMESWISTRNAGLADDELSSVVEVIDSVFPRIPLSSADWENIKKLMLFDKKNSNGSVRFVLLKSIGSATVDRAVAEHDLDESFHFYCNPK